MLAAAIGDCVHVAGLHAVLRIARAAGYRTVMLGPAVAPERVVDAIREHDPDVVALSYRLSPQAAANVLRAFERRVREAGLARRRFVFGGTPPVCRLAERIRLFERTFDGSEGPEAVEAYLRGVPLEDRTPSWPQSLPERVAARHPEPIIRHHYGQPSYEETLAGVRVLAESESLDVISLGVDQNTQEHFFHPDQADPQQDGAGGVPVRTPEQFRALYEASRTGNYPLMRSYSGTRDLIRMAEVLHETIHLAWGAIPLTWYSVLDGRSDRSLHETLVEAQEAMRWHAARGIPVEMNESHHWSLRDAHDTVAVVMAYLAARNARAAGVRHYVAQYMFNTPPETSFAMDLAKMLAKVELIESLQGPGFQVFRETRVGLRSHPHDLNEAKGHLAASAFLQMALRPHILHVVAFSEADHAATAPEIVESCRIARGVVRDALGGSPDLTADPRVRARKEELLSEAQVLLDAIASLAPAGVADPLTDPGTLTRAVSIGLVDAPHFLGNPAPEARGEVVTQPVDGKVVPVDPETGQVLSERERVEKVLRRAALVR
ncbi:methionine synthase [Limnochorda pilosa]|uniref:Methionine synthase n=1 Tax=Limnochorda pilosa TaxID=1555112 RepID=A0A0K2SPE4_LIMPI|nr:methionine synthase [Limnochorda pilosa]